MRMKMIASRGLAVMMAASAGLAASHAQSVQPMRFDLAPSGADAQTTLQVENNRTYPITIEINAERIDLDENGAEVLTAAEDDFLIFPPQVIIQPGITQSVRVRYIGAPDIERSQSYRVMVRQIPVDMSGQQRSGVSFAFNFATLGAVVPVGAKPDLVIGELTTEPTGRATVTIANNGAAYARALGYDWTLRSAEAEHVLSEAEVTGMLNGVSGLIPPGAERTFAFAIPDGFDRAPPELVLTAR